MPSPGVPQRMAVPSHPISCCSPCRPFPRCGRRGTIWRNTSAATRQATARRLCEEAGFEVVRATCFFFPLFFAAAAVKAIRLAGRALRGRAAAARAITDLAEGKTTPALSKLVLGLLAPERSWLRHGNLPLGTSILVLARPR
jgi:hypothetical protein